MSLVSQAEYARMHGVSRKSVTTWKQRKYLVMDGDQVNVEASNLKLARAGRAWPEVVTRAAEVSAGNGLYGMDGWGSWAAVDMEEAFDWRTRSGVSIGLPAAVSYNSIMAAAATADMARLTLRHLPPETVLPLLDEFYRQQVEGGLSLVEDGPLPPRGLPTWGHHPVFQQPAMSRGEWDQAVEEAAAWRAARGQGAHA